MRHMKAQRNRNQDLIRSAFGAALIVVSTQFIIPLGPVPLTLQTVVLQVLAWVFPPHQATRSVALYLVLGLVGFPVFSGGGGGLGHFAGPTGGYLLGFLVATFVIQAAQSRFRATPGSIISGLILHTVLILGFGALWLLILGNHTFSSVASLQIGLLLPSLIKGVLALILIRQLLKHPSFLMGSL